MAKDMMERMLESLVDHVFSKVGYTREQVQEKVGSFLKFGEEAHAKMNSVDAKLDLLIEAENERRTLAGASPLRNPNHGDSGGDALRITNGSSGG